MISARRPIVDVVRITLESRYFLPVCFLLFAVIRVAAILLVPITQTSDAAYYMHLGSTIASGQGYTFKGYPYTYLPVGYPGFLGLLFAIFGIHQIVGQLANLVLASGSFVLIWGIGRTIFRDSKVVGIALLVLAIYPNNIAYTPLLLTEVYLTFLLLLGTFLFITGKNIVWVSVTGLSFGLAALTAPQTLFLPALFVATELWFAKKSARGAVKGVIRRGIYIYFFMAVVLVPWAIRNSMVLGHPVLTSTNAGYTLLTGNNPSADGGFTEHDALVKKWHFQIHHQLASDHYATNLALHWIESNPVRFLELVPLKIWHLWAPDGEGEWAYQAGYSGYRAHKRLFLLLRIANQALYVFLIVGSIASVFLLKNLKKCQQFAWPPALLFGYSYIVYLTLISIVFSGQSRFHFPVMPWIILYASWVVVSFARDRSNLRTYLFRRVKN